MNDANVTGEIGNMIVEKVTSLPQQFTEMWGVLVLLKQQFVAMLAGAGIDPTDFFFSICLLLLAVMVLQRKANLFKYGFIAILILVIIALVI